MKNANAFRYADRADYLTWLNRWLRTGNQPTHFYDYPFARWTWLVAERDFTTGGELGSRAVSILVPNGIAHVGGELGHNGLFFMDGPDLKGLGVVPIFNDPEFAKVEGKNHFIASERAKDEAFEAEMNERSRRAEAASMGGDVGRMLRRNAE
ncbi:hypothetical protein [Nocardia sp. CNY236]|uniref:hypothetical protein n=1 Tax=Nocardia sp. CNY236 TaxID=1169152 RepID=UPI000428C34A|nr:hypothetical protein [Nocardia sp. CNY236]